ncbi:MULTISPECIES: FecR family protein [unclassified Spirosoma]|uniref:FecR family protein n=1 Tax=unclassified Spirosoma TaxID=2621999 RepID=UPI000967F76A|nr:MULTISPECIES: FecR domain-containing protein [unclassified Spirosoma]MBN8821497.1 FecR domain-containing protein [Spirosoma sp.]OJW78277.1 MAG: iron dicitrate transport regulator FecR [Spirosoma sp. 48-14]
MADQHPIDDALLGKFLAGETDPAESARVRQWLLSRNAGISEPTHDDFAKFERIWNAAKQGQRASKKGKTSTDLEQPDVDTDAAWKSVQQRMRSIDGRAENGAAIKPLPSQVTEPDSLWRQTGYRVAAVLALVVSLGWLVYQFRYMGHDNPAIHTVTLVTGDRQLRKTLPDGSRIVLNRHSTLTYPAAFADERRDVTLNGEAFFDVTPDPNRPFRIQARPTVVQVLGTSFTVRAYDNNVSVAVQTGKVRFSSGRKAVLLTKDQQATFDEQTDTIRRAAQLAPNAFAYKTGLLVFDNEPLASVIQTINQFYNSDVQLANARLDNCRLKTRFDKMSLDEVVAVTAETLGLQVRHEGKSIILDGAGCR